MSVQSGELFLLFPGVFSAKTSETEWEGTESVVYEVHNSQGGTNWMALSSLKDGGPDLKLGGGPEVQSSWLNSTLRRPVGMYGPHRGSQHGQVVFSFWETRHCQSPALSGMGFLTLNCSRLVKGEFSLKKWVLSGLILARVCGPDLRSG